MEDLKMRRGGGFSSQPPLSYAYDRLYRLYGLRSYGQRQALLHHDVSFSLFFSLPSMVKIDNLRGHWVSVGYFHASVKCIFAQYCAIISFQLSYFRILLLYSQIIMCKQQQQEQQQQQVHVDDLQRWCIGQGNE